MTIIVIILIQNMKPPPKHQIHIAIYLDMIQKTPQSYLMIDPSAQIKKYFSISDIMIQFTFGKRRQLTFGIEGYFEPMNSIKKSLFIIYSSLFHVLFTICDKASLFYKRSPYLHQTGKMNLRANLIIVPNSSQFPCFLTILWPYNLVSLFQINKF